jgi:hypothetical protein
MTGSSRVALVFFAAMTVVAAAQQSAGPPAFKFERPIVTNGEGPRRLAIDVPLLAGGRPFNVVDHGRRSGTNEPFYTADNGLGDLRLYEGNGREVPYLLVSNPLGEPAWRFTTILPVAPVETDKVKTTGFEADLGEAQAVDRLRIVGLVAPFMKRVRLEGSGDREHWTLLVGEGTLFDLPAEQLRQLDLEFSAGSYRYFRVTWDDTRSGRVAGTPVVSARMVAAAAPFPPLTAALTFDRRTSEPGVSRFRLKLPGAHLPIIALDLDVGGAHLLRSVVVTESRLSGYEAIPYALGQGVVRRVTRDDVTASSLRVWIAPPASAELELSVINGSNPPLDLRGVKAVFAQLPWIYFESPGGSVTVRYGNATLAAPAYDLEAAREKIAIDAVADAVWGDPRARTTEENGIMPAPPLPTTGAPLDPAAFTFVRPIPPGEAGLVAVPLDAAALAHSAGAPMRFADVRVIDGDGRQVPYLVERGSEPLTLDLTLERLSTLPKGLAARRPVPSVYRVRWPYERLPAPRLVLTTPARVFRRSVAVGRQREPNRDARDPWVEQIAAAAWVHAEQDTPAQALTLQLPTMLNEKEILVIVDEGDNAPLPIATAQLLLPAYRLRFFRQQGSALRLAYGRADLEPPRYDLALLSTQVLSSPATDVTAAAEPGGAEPLGHELISPRLFWILLAATVVVLLIMIARLLRREEHAESAK